MNEKKRPSKQKQSTGGGGSLFDGASGMVVHPMVGVSSGPYAEDLPVAGMTVGEVRRRFADRFDIGDNSAAILNGKPAKEEDILKAGENLMFVQHAGEKGAAKVVLDGTRAKYKSPEGLLKDVPLDRLAERMGPPMSTGSVILPSGIKAVLSRGNVTVWVWEKPPHIARFKWIATDSPKPYGPGTKYRNVRIALPYLVIFGVFARDHQGLPNLLERDECFFRNAPLKSVDDALCYPSLLNCSKFPHPDNNPLAWICTQYLKRTEKMESRDPGERFQAGFEAVRYCLLETSFNLSSEHHEGNSWYGATKHLDPRIATIEAWEKATKDNPLFVLEVPWMDTGHTVGSAVERIFKHFQSGKQVKSSDDVAQIINSL